MARQLTSINYPTTLSLRGSAYIGGDTSALASNYAHIQLLNPVSSGVIVTITGIQITDSSANRNLFINQFDTPLTTQSSNTENKSFGAPAPIAELRTQNNLTPLGATIVELRENQDATFVFKSDPPITLREGDGILVTSGTVSDRVSGIYEWAEEPA